MLPQADHACAAAAALVASIMISAYVYRTVGRRKQTGEKSTMKSQTLKPVDLQTANWECVGRIAKIWLYPVKSCCAVTLQTAETHPLGLKAGTMRDRSFMMATEKGTMITGRMIGKTLHIQPVVNGSTLVLKYPDMEDLSVDLDQVELDNMGISSNIFGDHVPGLDCGDVVAQWLEKALNKKTRLLYHGNISSPRKTETYVGEYPLVRDDDNSLYADKFPYMLMTKESIADLQSRVNCPLYPENFRPNILVDGSKKPYDEEDWAYVKIGSAVFRNLAPCPRCSFITIDHKTGIKEPNMEPLRTLRQYRPKEDNSPFFGVNLGVEVVGTIEEGDEIYVTRLSQMKA